MSIVTAEPRTPATPSRPPSRRPGRLRLHLGPALVRLGDGAAGRDRARRPHLLSAGPRHLPVVHQPHRGQPAVGDLHQVHHRRRRTASPTRTAGSSSGVDNYVEVLTGEVGEFWQWLGITLIWTVACVVFHYLIGLGLAVLLNRPMRGAASTGCC